MGLNYPHNTPPNVIAVLRIVEEKGSEVSLDEFWGEVRKRKIFQAEAALRVAVHMELLHHLPPSVSEPRKIAIGPRPKS